MMWIGRVLVPSGMQEAAAKPVVWASRKNPATAAEKTTRSVRYGGKSEAGIWSKRLPTADFPMASGHLGVWGQDTFVEQIAVEIDRRVRLVAVEPTTAMTIIGILPQQYFE